MAHEITLWGDVAEAAFALKPAWHGLGTVLDHPMSSAEALTRAHLDWSVVQRQVGIATPHTIETPEGEVQVDRYVEVEGQLANVRGDNAFFLGFVSKHYKVVQNVEAFSFLDRLIEAHEMTYEAAFSLNGGKRVVLLGRLPVVDTIVPGDDTLRYVLLSLHHDGTGEIRFGPTAVRVVCAYTYALALDKGTIANMDGDFTREAAIRHSGDVEKKLEAARKLLAKANKAFDHQAEASRLLAARRFTFEEWRQYLDLMCPVLDPRDPDWTEQRQRRIDETRQMIGANYRNPRQLLSGIECSAWAAFNAVTEHIDQLPRRGATRERRAEARFNVTQYGPGRDMKERAFALACKFANIEQSA